MRRRAGVLIFLAVLALAGWLFFQNRASEDSGTGHGLEPLSSGGGSHGVAIHSPQGERSSRADLLADSEKGPSENDLTGCLFFLDLLSQSPPLGSVWRLTDSRNGKVRQIEVSSPEALCGIPEGDYTLDCFEGGWKPVGGVVALEPSREAVVWVYHDVDLKIRVLGEGQRPVTGALVHWLPRLPSQPGSPVDWPRKVAETIQASRTDSDGLAGLADIQSGIGSLFVMADGYALREIRVNQLIHGTLTVRLRKRKGPSPSLQFLEFSSQQPLSGVRLFAERWFLPGESDALGQFQLPSWMKPGMWVKAQKEGFSLVDAKVPENGKTLRVPMFPSHKLVIQTVDETNQVFPKAWVSFKNEENSFANVVPPPFVQTDGQGRVKVELPQGGRFLLRSLSEDGRSAEEKVEIQPGMAPVVLVLKRGKDLEISLVSSSGNVLHAVQCMVRWETGDLAKYLPIKADESANLFIPFPNLVGSIKMKARGSLAVNLQPNPSNSVDRGGLLPFRLGAAHRLKLHLQDENGIPISGMRIYAGIPRENVEIFRKYPELEGAEPTEHPGWVERTKYTSLEAISDGQGNCIFSDLSGDSYDFHPVFPWILGSDSMYGSPRLTVHVADAPEEVDWTLPRPKKVEVEALDGFTLEPVKRFTVRAESPSGPTSLDSEDSNFSGWVPAVEKYLTVSSPGYQEVRVDLDPSKPSESFSVRLFPGQVGNLVLQGQAKELAGQTITLFFQRIANPEDPAHPFFVRDHEVRIQVEDPNRVPFPLPGGEGYFLGLIAHYSKGFLWSFSPYKVPIQGTNDLVFVAKRRAFKGDPSGLDD